MKVMYSGRQFGKTTEIIKKAHATGSYIVVATRKDAQRISKHAEDLGINIRFPVTWEELVSAGYSTGFVKDIVIDDLDRIIQNLFQQKIHLVTMTKDEE